MESIRYDSSTPGAEVHSRTSITQFFSLILILSLSFSPAGIDQEPFLQKDDQSQPGFTRFDLLTPESGWVLPGQHLFWTSDAGQTWDEIGPSAPSDATIQAVEFIDFHTGWLLWMTVNMDGSASFTLAHTLDHGVTWDIRPLSLFDAGEISAHSEEASMGWFDPQTGWIAVRQAGSSNFSQGTLFTTSNGGNTWARSTLPVVDQVIFSEPQTGWSIGEPTANQIFRTQDGGVTWQKGDLDPRPDSYVTVYKPFYSNGRAVLVTTSLGSMKGLDVYILDYPSGAWLLAGHVPLDIEPGSFGLSILDPENFVATIAGTKSIVRMKNGNLDVLENQDGLSASIVDLDMVTLDVGWARSIEANCVTASSFDNRSASVSCASSTRLLQTKDGGLTWQNLELPSLQIDTISPRAAQLDHSLTTSATPNIANTEVFVGQGFDKCEIPPISQLQTWWDASPYKTVNLYIGGSSRRCSNVALTSSFLQQVHRQGWKFFPTWVGPQAPCTNYVSRLSADVIIAYDQGMNEANLAVERLFELGLTYPDKTGSVVYYDIEHYGTNPACRSAVNAFMNGWVSQLHALGNLAGVYGSTLCNTGLSDFLTIAHVPDVIWPARWYHNLGEGYYDPTATVWNLGSCVPNTVWVDHQRIRQYEGDHDEIWGDLTLAIDSNVLDGVVAIPYYLPSVNSILRKDASPTSAASVNFNIGFSKPVTGVDTADFTLATTGVTGASITAVSGSGASYNVAVNTGSGDGTIRLEVVDDDSIRDAANFPLGGSGIANGDFTSGETYQITKYYSNVNRWTSAFDLSHGWTVGDYVRTVGDVNGDGKDDLVGFGLDGVYVALSTGNGFDPVSGWTSSFDLSHGWTVSDYVRTVGDVNGDGKDDLVGFGLDGVYVALSNGGAFGAISKWTSAFDLSHGWTVSDYVRTVGDVNDDGKADLVGFGLDGVYVALTNGSSFDAISKWTSSFDLSHGWTVSQYVRTVGDVNGDGKADLVGFGLDGVYIALSNGGAFGSISKWTSAFDLSHGWTVSDYVRTMGDMNGDGRDDVVGFGLDGVYVALSTGSGFTPVSRWTSAFDLWHGWTVGDYVRTIGDVNGDGKADLVGFGLDGVYVATSK